MYKNITENHTTNLSCFKKQDLSQENICGKLSTCYRRWLSCETSPQNCVLRLRQVISMCMPCFVYGQRTYPSLQRFRQEKTRMTGFFRIILGSKIQNGVSQVETIGRRKISFCSSSDKNQWVCILAQYFSRDSVLKYKS